MSKRARRGSTGGGAGRSAAARPGLPTASQRPAPTSDSIAELTREALAFRDERHWKQFHNFKDLALTLNLEAAEVLEHTQWKNGEELATYLTTHRDAVSDELADVLHVVLLLAEHLEIELATAFRQKMRKNADKYPVSKARGTHRKYTHL